MPADDTESARYVGIHMYGLRHWPGVGSICRIGEQIAVKIFAKTLDCNGQCDVALVWVRDIVFINVDIDSGFCSVKILVGYTASRLIFVRRGIPIVIIN